MGIIIYLSNEMKYATLALLAAMVSDVSAQAYVSPEKRYTTAGGLPECHGNNGPLGINCVAPPCSGTNGPKDGPTGTPCLQDEPADILTTTRPSCRKTIRHHR